MKKISKLLSLLLIAVMIVSCIPLSASAETTVTVGKTTSFTVTSKTVGTALLKWAKVTDSQGYFIYRSETSTGGYKLVKIINNLNTVQWADSGRTPGMTYYYKLCPYKLSNGSYVRGGYTAAHSVTMKVPSITASSATAIGAGSIGVAWSKVEGATGYQVLRSTSASGTYKKIATVKSGSTLYYEDTGLTAGDTLYYKIRAYQKVGTKYYFGAFTAYRKAKVLSEGTAVYASSVKLSTSLIDIKVCETSTLTGTVSPSNATMKAVRYVSSNTSIATVDYYGKVKGINPGVATITVYSADGKASAKCTVKVRSRKSGFVNVDGYLYYYSNGIPVTNKTVNNLKFGSDGRYTSGNTTLDAKVAAIIRNYTTESMTQKQKLKALNDYMKTHYDYKAVDGEGRIEWVDVAATGWENAYALRIFTYKVGICYSWAAGFTTLARGIGYDAKAISGYCTSWLEWGWSRHAFTEITISGVTYICDPELEHAYGYDYFFKTEAQEKAIDPGHIYYTHYEY